MLILQIPRRMVALSGDGPITFPADVHVTAELGPRELFGAEPLSGRLSLRPAGKETKLEADTFHGGIRLPAGDTLPGVTVDAALFDLTIVLRGARAEVRHRMSAEAGFLTLINILVQAVPAYVSAAARAPVEVTAIRGTIEGHPFEVQCLAGAQEIVRVVDVGHEITKKLTRIQALPEEAYARVTSAHRYVLQAHRLRYASSYPSQFVGERLLNLYKAVEVLFGRKVENLRAALRGLRVVNEVAELLAALVYIRDETDVGHPAIAALTQSEYETVHAFLVHVEEIVTWLLDHVVDEVVAERFKLTPLSEGRPKRTKTIARLAQASQMVAPLRVETFAKPAGKS